jgi:hypothetical protein
LHRCLQRHGISCLPEVVGDKPAKQPFKAYPIGYFHIDIAEARTEAGKLYLFVAIDRTSKYAFARLMQNATTSTARTFLDELVEAVPYKIHAVLTDNGAPTCPKAGTGPPQAGADVPSTEPAGVTASSIASLSPTIPGPTVKLNGWTER